jgi:acetyl CoA:N6-hydroxylysine acetyl transferase
MPATSSTLDRRTNVVRSAFSLSPDAHAVDVLIEGANLEIRPLNGPVTSWTLMRRDNREALLIQSAAPRSEASGWSEVLAAIEASFISEPHLTSLLLQGHALPAGALLLDGFAVAEEAEGLRVLRDMFWQQGRIWLRQPGTSEYPRHCVSTGGARHPRRRGKPSGVLYTRFIPWLYATLSFRTLDATRDLGHLHKWMNDPSVDAFWQEAGDIAEHQAYIQKIADDPHTLAVIACIDEAPFGYFEIYWAKEDRIAPFCEAGDFDRGWHVLVGEHGFRGKPYVTAWLASMSHYLFLDDSRTQRIVIEPRADNRKMIRNLEMGGYAMLGEFDFPHKRAMLGMLGRERFFNDALWIPKTDISPLRQ